MLEVEGLHAGYSGLEVVHGVSFGVGKGEVVAIFGPNGAGKSTVLKAISGVLKPSAGRVLLNSRDITLAGSHERVRFGLAHVPEGRRVFPGLTVTENLKTARLGKETSYGERLRFVYELFPILSERHGQKAWSLSGGEQQMLSLGRALMTSPDVLLMDEPSLGLAPGLVRPLFTTLSILAQNGLTVLLVEQNIRTALEHAARYIVLSEGVIAGRAYVEDAGRSASHLEESYFGRAPRKARGRTQ